VGLLLLPLFVLLVFLGCCFPIIIREVDLFREFDAKLALFDPGGFRFELQTIVVELLQNRIIDAGDHIWGLDKGERERGLQVDGCADAREGELRVSVEGAETLLLGKDVQVNWLLGVKEFRRIFSIVFLGVFEVPLTLRLVSKDLVNHTSDQK
jgi:hypothetical protein